MLYVLPTASIVREFREYNRLFSFYEDDIKGIIRDTILVSSAWMQKDYSRYHHEIHRPLMADDLMEKIIRDYHNSGEALMQRLSENTSSETYIQRIVEQINRQVGDMMMTLFLNYVYDVSKTEWQWIGDDLVVKITIYRNDH